MDISIVPTPEEEVTSVTKKGLFVITSELNEKDSSAVLVEPSALSDTKPGTDAQDGGALAWLQCAGSFVIFFNTWGMINVFGVYQQFYQTRYIPDQSSSSISWIGSIQGCLVVGCAILTGPLLDRGYLRSLIAVGTALVVFGMMMLSISTKYWHLLLSQGLVMGLGNGCLFIPSIGVIPTYFKKRRALALGIAASGSSIGGVLYSIMFHWLEPSIGFGWTNRVFGFMVLGLQTLPLISMKQRLIPAKRREFLDMTALKEAPFLFYLFNLVFVFMGLYVPFFHLQEYAAVEGIITGQLNFYIIAFLNAGGFFGRLLPNYLADVIGPMNVLVVCTIVTAILAFLWIAIKSAAGIIVLAVLYGFFSGAVVSLCPSVAAAITPNLHVLGTRMGMTTFVMAIGMLVGNPLAGAIEKSGWLHLQVFGAACVMVAIVCLTGSRVAFAGWGIAKA